MLEIFFLVVAGSAIAAYARGRGGSPWVWGSVAIGGYFLLGAVLPFALRVSRESDTFPFFWVAGLGWLGLTTLCARFLLGRGRPAPSGLWVCPNCKMLNAHYSVLCEACRQPYGRPGAASAQKP
jgi:hypothetical protein